MTDSTLSEDCSDVKPSEQAADIRRLQSKVESLERELAVLSGKMDKLEKNRREDSGSIVSRLFGGNDDNGAAVGKRHSGFYQREKKRVMQMALFSQTKEFGRMPRMPDGQFWIRQGGQRRRA